MKILQLQLYILIICEAADQLLDLGSNVTINCDLDENEVYWILLNSPAPPTVILRSLSTPVPPFYSNKAFRNRYSVQFKHRLVINNVTAHELGVYYCMNTGITPKLGNSTRIYITEADQLNVCCNMTAKCNEKNNNYTEQNPGKWQTFFIISGVMNGILAMAVVGLVNFFVVRKRRSAKQTQVTEQQQDQAQLQYATMDFSKFRKKMRSSQVDTTYAALNLPKS